jgi:hypothetical protein
MRLPANNSALAGLLDVIVDSIVRKLEAEWRHGVPEVNGSGEESGAESNGSSYLKPEDLT